MNGAETVAHALAHIAAEHRDLERRATRLFQRVRQRIDEDSLPVSIAGLTLNLQELRDLMKHHFAQEAAGGYLEEAVARVPRLAGAADAVEKQHPELLRDLSALAESVKTAEPSIDAWEQLGVGVAAFTCKLLAHEVEENRILHEGFNEDPALFDLDNDQ
jgi:iron-sulfur cluster repair protein YtfE (RIC family)